MRWQIRIVLTHSVGGAGGQAVDHVPVEIHNFKDFDSALTVFLPLGTPTYLSKQHRW